MSLHPFQCEKNRSGLEGTSLDSHLFTKGITRFH